MRWWGKKTTINNSLTEIGTKLILKITIIALLSSVTFCLNLMFKFIPGLNFNIFILIISFIFFRCGVAFGIVNTCCALELILNGTMLEIVGYTIVMNFYGIITIFLRKAVIRWWWITIILMFLYTLGINAINIFQWYLIYDLNTAWSLHLTRRINRSMGYIFSILVPILIYPFFWSVLFNYKEKWRFIFNPRFLKTEQQNLWRKKTSKKTEIILMNGELENEK